MEIWDFAKIVLLVLENCYLPPRVMAVYCCDTPSSGYSWFNLFQLKFCMKLTFLSPSRAFVSLSLIWAGVRVIRLAKITQIRLFLPAQYATFAHPNGGRRPCIEKFSVDAQASGKSLHRHDVKCWRSDCRKSRKVFCATRLCKLIDLRITARFIGYCRTEKFKTCFYWSKIFLFHQFFGNTF